MTMQPDCVPSLSLSKRNYVEDLTASALHHRAVHHPYLKALAAGTLPDTRWALRDFAQQYYSYSKNFPKYLQATIAQLSDPRHRLALMENLAEESGHYEEEELSLLERYNIRREWIVDQPHPVLFRRFADALGADLDNTPESDASVCWSEMFLLLLTHGTPAEAVGALGLGTENIVSTIYQSFVIAIGRTELSIEDTVFFPLHTQVDDAHLETLQDIAVDLAQTPEGRQGLRRGMLKALQLRSVFWDWMYERALDPMNADSVL